MILVTQVNPPSWWVLRWTKHVEGLKKDLLELRVLLFDKNQIRNTSFWDADDTREGVYSPFQKNPNQPARGPAAPFGFGESSKIEVNHRQRD